MGHRIAVMSAGSSNRWRRPRSSTPCPANTFVARFLGSPGHEPDPEGAPSTSGAPAALAVALPGASVPLPEPVGAAVRRAGPDVVLGLRPEALRLDPTGRSRRRW